MTRLNHVDSLNCRSLYRFRPEVRFLPIVFVLLCLLLLYSQSVAVTAIGPGVAGQIHAVVYDPRAASGDTIIVGGDICGVIRTDDGGDSWYFWSKGLQSSDGVLTSYVDDLCVIDEDALEEYRGYYAATRAGIYYRGFSDFQWTLDTDRDYYSYTGGYFGSSGCVIQFSCFAYDAGDSILYAGAGHSRVSWNDNVVSNRFYPIVPETDFDAGGQWNNKQYSLWSLDCNMPGSSWQPVDGTENLGSVRQVAVTQWNDKTYVVFASSDGIFFDTVDSESGWSNLTDSYTASGFPGVGEPELSAPWGVGFGSDGILYGSFRLHETGYGGDFTSGVWKNTDPETDPPHWQLLGNEAQIIPPHGAPPTNGEFPDEWTLGDLITGNVFANPEDEEPVDFTMLSVRPAIDGDSEKDEIFAGVSFETHPGGYFVYTKTALDDSAKWRHTHCISGNFYLNPMRHWYIDLNRV